MIKKWFEKDFRKAAGSVQAYVAPFLPEPFPERVAGGGYAIAYTDYDWSLNDKGSLASPARRP